MNEAEIKKHFIILVTEYKLALQILDEAVIHIEAISNELEKRSGAEKEGSEEDE